MNGHKRFLAALRCEEVDKLPTHWHGPEPAGLYIKEFKEFIDQEDTPELEECFEITPLGDITILNWYSRGTSSNKKIGTASYDFPVVYYNPDKDWFYTQKEAKKLPASKKNFRITAYGEIRQY